MIINFECKKCQKEFDCDVGKILVSEETMEPTFEKDIECPRCGKVSKGDVLLTETGQTQMTDATWGS